MLTYAQPDLPAACNAETQPERWRTDHEWQLSQRTAEREERRFKHSVNIKPQVREE